MGLTFLGTGSALPKKQVSNFELEQIHAETSDEWIRSKTGIASRHIITSETLNELIEKAARDALSEAEMDPLELDLIIVASMTGETILPSAACRLQFDLGADCPAFDINAACSGFLYALDIAQKYYMGNRGMKILIVGAETLSRITDWGDYRTCVLFGDGAGAAVLGDGEGNVLYTEISAQGENGDVLGCGGVGAEHFPGESERGQKQIVNMDGRRVFEFAVRNIREKVARLIEKAGWDNEMLSYILPHQANFRIIKEAAKKLKIPIEKFLMNIEHTGNTSAASIAILLDEMKQNGTLSKGNRLGLVAFGGGLTAASAAIEL